MNSYKIVYRNPDVKKNFTQRATRKYDATDWAYTVVERGGKGCRATVTPASGTMRWGNLTRVIRICFFWRKKHIISKSTREN